MDHGVQFFFYLRLRLPSQNEIIKRSAEKLGKCYQCFDGSTSFTCLNISEVPVSDTDFVCQLLLRQPHFLAESLYSFSCFNRIVTHKKSFPEHSGEGLLTPYKASGKQKAPYKSEWLWLSHNHSNLVRRLAVSSGSCRILSACSIKSCRVCYSVICAGGGNGNPRTSSSGLRAGSTPD